MLSGERRAWQGAAIRRQRRCRGGDDERAEEHNHAGRRGDIRRGLYLIVLEVGSLVLCRARRGRRGAAPWLAGLQSRPIACGVGSVECSARARARKARSTLATGAVVIVERSTGCRIGSKGTRAARSSEHHVGFGTQRRTDKRVARSRRRGVAWRGGQTSGMYMHACKVLT